MRETWQYNAVEMPAKRGSMASAPASLVEDMGQQGWVLLAMVTDPGVYGGKTWAYFKRSERQLAAA